MPNNRATTADKAISDSIDKHDSPRDQHLSKPATYMELQPGPQKRNHMHFLSTRVYRVESRILDITMWD